MPCGLAIATFLDTMLATVRLFIDIMRTLSRVSSQPTPKVPKWCGLNNNALIQVDFLQLNMVPELSIIALVSIVATTVVAQTVAIPPGTPACLISCLTANCPTLDFNCICVTEINEITTCATNNCSASTLGAAATVGQEICMRLSFTTLIDVRYSCRA